jgi:hypothetical protein
MSNPRAVALLAERLPHGLTHPGDPNSNQPAKVIPLPGLSDLGMPPGMAEFFAREAGLPANDAPKVIAEAIVHTLKINRLKIVSEDYLEQLIADAATLEDIDPSAPIVGVFCKCNREKPIVGITIGRARAIISGKALRAMLDEVCSCA